MLEQFFEVDKEQEKLESKLEIINKETETITKTKGLSPFDFINNIYKKVPWESYSESEQKSFNTFIVNRSLSMNMEFTDLISQLQHLTSVMPAAAIYKMYSDLLTKPKGFSPFIKAKKADLYTDDLIELLVKYYKLSSREIYIYLDILTPEEVIQTLKKFGKTDKEIKKIYKY